MEADMKEIEKKERNMEKESVLIVEELNHRVSGLKKKGILIIFN